MYRKVELGLCQDQARKKNAISPIHSSEIHVEVLRLRVDKDVELRGGLQVLDCRLQVHLQAPEVVVVDEVGTTHCSKKGLDLTDTAVGLSTHLWTHTKLLDDIVRGAQELGQAGCHGRTRPVVYPERRSTGSVP